MSIVVNGAAQIAQHFGTTTEHVLDVYTQYQVYNSSMWFEFAIAWSIITIIVSLGVAYILYKGGYNVSDAAGAFATTAMAVGFLVGMLAAAVFSCYLSGQPTVIEYELYYNWIKGVVGV